MRNKYSVHPIRSLVLSFIYLTSALTGNSFAQEQNKYVRAVHEFADNVLKYGRDVYGLKHTPLFVDGLQWKSLKPVIWKKDEQSWMLCNFASQQPLLRTLDGLTALTGQKEYRKAAEAATGYALKHLRTPNGRMITSYSMGTPEKHSLQEILIL